jgi:tetratricopeptide (TPR) repeat protein
MIVWLLNIATPGAGLIWRGRVVEGLLLATLFAPPACVVIVAGLIAPAAIDPWTTVICAALAGGSWLRGQLRLWRLTAGRRDPRRRAELEALLCAAEEQFAAGDDFEALLTLTELIERDETFIPAWLLRARIYAAAGKLRRAAEAIEQARRLDRKGDYRAQIDRAAGGCALSEVAG